MYVCVRLGYDISIQAVIEKGGEKRTPYTSIA